MPIELKSAREIATMRRANRITAEALRRVSAAVRPGVTTEALDRIAREVIASADATPAFVGVPGPVGVPPFPAAICASVNEEVVHGIPGPRKLREGDIVSIDVGVRYRGYIGDAAVTVGVGRISEADERLLRATRESLDAGIAAARVGGRLTDIGAAVEARAARDGFSVVRQYVGHGVGREMHEEPQVPNFGPGGEGPVLEAGMTLAIEPMVNAGTWETEVLADGWTVVTKDRSRSAHFEHSIALAVGGPEILSAEATPLAATGRA